MGENTKIEWCDHTFNPWIGCTKISPGCDNCYAEEMAKRFWPGTWGPAGMPRLSSKDTWRAPLRWNRAAEAKQTRPRVFCASIADVFDNQVPKDWRYDLFDLIEVTPHLDWLLLTKRPQNIEGNQLADLTNVWLGVSAENQEEAERRIPLLLKIKAAKHFVSLEPLLSPIELWYVDEDVQALRGPGVIVSGGVTVGTPDHPPEGYDDSYAGLDWVIVGGESGRAARPMHPSWAWSLHDQCKRLHVPFFMKQMSGRAEIPSGLFVREFP